jgi:thiamine-monophosphate kinase
MALGEFSLIDRFFKKSASPANAHQNGDVGIGDDAAIVAIPQGHRLVVSKDVLVQDRHFFADVPAQSLGHKSLAVNLSDLAAMGATPIGCLLGLGLPAVHESWLGAFAQGLHDLAKRYDCPLIGGDTVASPQGVFVSVTALGALPATATGLLRSAAQVDDDIWVSGALGAPDLALRIMQSQVPDPQNRLPALKPALQWPQPRVELGQRLLAAAHAAIDISDGLCQDLGHILKASGVGAMLEIARLPVDQRLAGFDAAVCEHAVLQGGDVYELCFTAPPTARQQVEQIGQDLQLPLTRIGVIRQEPGLLGQYPDGRCIELAGGGFDHFATEQP